MGLMQLHTNGVGVSAIYYTQGSVDLNYMAESTNGTCGIHLSLHLHLFCLINKATRFASGSSNDYNPSPNPNPKAEKPGPSSLIKDQPTAAV